MDPVYADSLKLHQKFHGKLAVSSKVPLENKADLSLAYTPGVAEVSRAIARDKSLAKEYTIKHNSIAVITDGSAILGLGNLGPEAALPVMEGKAILFKQFAGIDAFPICLDTQDTEEIIKTVRYLAPGFGGINLEDISAPRCFEIEKRLIRELAIPVMHDDQRGTATVVLAGLINAFRLTKADKTKVKIVINGAGAAGTAIAKMLVRYGIKNIVVCDTRGALYAGRADMNEAKKELAELVGAAIGQGLTLAEAMAGADVFIGVSAPNTVTADMVRSMNKNPVIFAMANPVPEIMPDIAKSAGAFIVATGRSDFPNQINNVLAFPGIFRGALDNNVRSITDEMLVGAAENLAEYVKEVAPDFILPSPLDKNVVKVVARAIK